MLHEDLEMRRVILARLRNAGIAKIETERSSNAQLTVTIHTAKPGIVIGKGGSSVDQLREDLEKRFGNRVRISIQEIKQPELDAQLVAENIASQIERRISYKRAMKQAILRTLRANIDFGRATANTTFGAIGVKCWIYKDVAVPLKKQPVADGAPIADAITIAPQPEAPEAIEPQVAVAQPEAAPAAAVTTAPRRPRVAAKPATEEPAAAKPRAAKAQVEAPAKPAAKPKAVAKP